MPLINSSLFADKRRLAIIALILANIIWGASLPIYKWTLENIHPFTFAFLRFFLSLFILFPFVIGKFKFEKKDIPKLIFGAIISITVQIPLLFFGLQLAPSINAPIIISAGPILLLGSSIIFLKEKISKKLLAGTSISLLGVFLLMFNPAFESGIGGGVLGNFFIFLATICGVIQALILKKILERNGDLITIFLTFLIGSLTLLPFALLEYNSVGLFTIDMKAIFGILFAVIFASVVAHYFFFYGLKKVKASETGIFTYVDPIATILVAIPLLHEVITESYLIAAVLVFLGIYIAEGRIHYHPLNLLRKTTLGKISESV
jgi:drug/metabolite transporter (DMT)-like permease